MNRLAWSAVVVGSLSLSSLARLDGGSCVWAQSASTPRPAAPTAPALPTPPPIPDDARTGPNPQTYATQISANINANLARIKSLDTRAVKDARAAMVGDVSGLTTTSTFKDVYAQQLATALQPLLGESDNRVRLQVMVTAAAVAAAVDNSRLEPVALKAMQDENPAIKLWGLKTAKGVMKYLLTQPGLMVTSQLPKAIADTAVANATRNELARDAVEALYLDIVALQNLKPAPTSANIKELVTPAMRILEARAAVYKKEVPEDSDGDQTILTFFSNTAWGWLTPAQQTQLVQLAFNVLLPVSEAAEKTGDRSTVQLAIRVGRNLSIVAKEMRKSEPAAQAFLDATAFFQQITAIAPPASEIRKAAQTTFDAARKVPSLKGLSS